VAEKSPYTDLFIIIIIIIIIIIYYLLFIFWVYGDFSATLYIRKDMDTLFCEARVFN
jgi:hypothetical protein